MSPFAAKFLVGSLAALASATVALASPASAARADDVPTLVVHYNADALQSDSGAESLYRRLARAAEQVCPIPTGSRLANPLVTQCRRDAISAAVNKIHNQRLAAVHAAAGAKSG